MSKAIDYEKFERNANKKYNNKFKYFKDSYTDYHTKTKILCPKHGEIWMIPFDHIHHKAACYECGKESRIEKRRKKIDFYIEQANKVHNYIYDYSKAIYIGTHSKLEIICKEHGSFWQRAKDHLTGCICPKCASISTGNFHRMTFEEFEEKSRLIHGNKYSYFKDSFISAMKKAKILCPKHGYFWQSPNSHYFGEGCKRCSHCVSRMETKWLDYNNIEINNRNCIMPGLDKRISVDGWKEINGEIYVYEFYGSFWHGDPRIFDKDRVNNVTKCTFGHLYQKTINREEVIKKAGYKLITMWEKDFKESQKLK